MTRIWLFFGGGLLLFLTVLGVGAVVTGELRGAPTLSTITWTRTAQDYHLELIDTGTRTTHRIPIERRDNSVQVELLPDGRHVMLTRLLIDSLEVSIVDMLDKETFTVNVPSSANSISFSPPGSGIVTLSSYQYPGTSMDYVIDYYDHTMHSEIYTDSTAQREAQDDRQAVRQRYPGLIQRLIAEYGSIESIQLLPDKDWLVFQGWRGRWQTAYTVYAPSHKVYPLNPRPDTAVRWVRWASPGHYDDRVLYAIYETPFANRHNTVYLADPTLSDNRPLVRNAMPFGEIDALIPLLDTLDMRNRAANSNFYVFSLDGDLLGQSEGSYIAFHPDGRQAAFRRIIDQGRSYDLMLLSLESGQVRRIVSQDESVVWFNYLYDRP